jgi:predicted phage terminase large subunit-like protein
MIVTPAEYRLLIKNDLHTFIERCFRHLNPQIDFQSNWHIAVIAAILSDVMRGKSRRVIINLPPRHLKSISVTVAFIAWYLGHHPSRHVIAVSYGQDLADKFARDCRNVMKSPFYCATFPTRLAERKAVADFMTQQGGSRMATSVGGVLTGRGADLIVLDDPQKPDEALSETKRNYVNSWYSNSLLSRLNDKRDGAIIVTMQRLHQDDLVGHVLEQEGWEVVSFPAIAEEDEIHEVKTICGLNRFVRKTGEALHPARESLTTLNIMRQTIGEYDFASQYQQTPIPKGGAMVRTEWLRYYAPNELPKIFSMIVQSWDTANKTTELSDYSVCTTWGLSNGKFYLLDVFRKRLNYPDLKRAVLEQKRKFGTTHVIIEDKASGTQLIQDLKADGILNVKGIEHLPGTDKTMRLHSKTVCFENGQVLLPKDAPWLVEYVKEITGFPGTKYDDQVDSTTQALDYLQGPARLIETWIRCLGPQ